MINRAAILVSLSALSLCAFAPPSKDGFHDAAKSFHAPSTKHGLAHAGLYRSDDGSVQLVLEKTAAGWRYAGLGDADVIALKEKVNYRGDRLFLQASDGRVVVKIAAVGGVTAFTEEQKFGVPVVRVGAASDRATE